MRLASNTYFNTHYLRLGLVTVLMIASQAANAQAISTQRIISAPSAQTINDGQIEFGLNIDKWGEHARLDYQVTPWLNMGVAYSNFELASPIPVEQRYPAAYSYNFNAQIVQETDVWPAIAIGMEDFTDNADIKAQFVVASKQFGQWRVDMGFAKGANTRRTDTQTSTHSNGLNGLFGGVHYTLTDYPVRFSAQYIDDVQGYSDIADEYALTGNSLSVAPSRHQPWSLQAQWQFTPGITLSLTHSKESSIGLGLTVALDTKRTPARQKSPSTSEQAPPPSAPLPSVKNTSSLQSRIKDSLAAMNIKVHSVVVNELDNSGLQVVISQTAYPYWPDAIHQAHQQLLLLLPKYITHIDYVVKLDGHLVYRIRRDVIRDPIMAKFVSDMTPRALTSSILNDANSKWLSSMPDFTVKLAHQGWLSPQNIQNTQNIPRENTREKMSQLLQAHVDIDWEFAPQWSIKQQTQLDLAERWSFSERQAIDKYVPTAVEQLVDKDIHISQLMLRYANSYITTEYDTHTQYDYQLYAGLLDNEWAGVGSNLLFQPWQSRLSVGLSVAHLSARDSTNAKPNGSNKNRTMALASVYWASPFYDLDVALHAGRFVHQDTGAKIQIRRSFNNGWQFGIWASQTSRNAISESHQGLSLSIPLDNVFNQYVGGKTYFTSRINQLDNTHAVMLESDASARWWKLRAARFSVFSDVNATTIVSIDMTSADATSANTMSLEKINNNWSLTVGQYQVTGQVSALNKTELVDTHLIDTDMSTTSAVAPTAPTNKHTQYVFRSVQGDELIFDADGLVKITTLAKRPLALSFNEVKGLRQVTLGDLNYTVYACSPLNKAGYSATQTCQSQPEHRIQIQYDNEFQPVAINQWVPYLKQQFHLHKVN